MLKNAKDACATGALEIATYTALERLDRSVGDAQTATLATSIRADEEKMLQRILREIPKLTVRRYERAHKNRAGVIQAAERELSTATASGASSAWR